MTSKQNNAFIEGWYTKFNGQLTRFLGKAVSKDSDLFDLSQEIYLRMLRVKNPELIQSPRAYLFKVAIHVIDEWRNSNREQYVHVENDENNAIDSSNKYLCSGLNGSSKKIDLNKALTLLPEIHSTTIIMKWHYGMSYKEIAQELDLSERQVKRYIVKGYTELRIKLMRME